MGDEIQNPMAQHQDPDDRRCSPCAEESPGNERRDQRPSKHEEKTVAPWIGVESKRSERRVTRVDPDLFHSQQ
jgi:hypothetical protein